jgi:hypothetical protein
LAQHFFQNQKASLKERMFSLLVLALAASGALAQETMGSNAPALVLGYPTQLDITSKAQPCELQVTREFLC